MGRGTTVAICAAVSVITATGSARAATPSQIIASVNAQRAAAGLPGGITENPAWSAACHKHNRYMQAHGNQLNHGEPDTSHPTYSTEGDAVAKGSVLSYGISWDTRNPFENAPIHLHQLLVPRLNTMGADEHAGLVCATTFGPGPTSPGFGRRPAAKPILYTYPGAYAAGLPTSEVADERPFTPGEVLGIPRGTTTGRYIHLFVDGPWATNFPRVKITSASIKTRDGKNIPLKIADSEVRTPDGQTLGAYMPQGAQLIPLEPLPADAVLDAKVEALVQGTKMTKKWTFGTGSAKPTAAAKANPRLRVSKIRFRRGRIQFTIAATSTLVGRNARLSFKVPGRKASKRTLKLRTSRTVSIRARRATLTIRVGAYTVDGVRYGPFRVTARGG